MKATLEALDGLPITPRTGKSKCQGEMTLMEPDRITFIYDESEKTESPGVFVMVHNLEKIDNVFRFFNEHLRKFELVILP